MGDGMATNLGGLIPEGGDLDKVAIIDLASGDAREYSHRELSDLANAIARGLLKRGLKRGDAISLIAENSVPYFAAYMGIMRAGMVCVPVNHKQPENVISHVLTDSETKLVLLDGVGRDRCPEGYDAVHFDCDGADGFEALLDPGPFEIIDPEIGETAMILYTSGSTGMPKGVLLDHRSHLFALSRLNGQRETLVRQRFLIAAPLYHMNGLFSAKLNSYMNASLVLLPRFDVSEYIRSIKRFGVTWVTSVPTMLARAIRETEIMKSTDLSGVEWVSMGSAPLTQSLFDEVQGWFPNATVFNLYGTTEHGPSAFGSHPDGLLRPNLSLGYQNAGVELRLVGGADENTGVLEVRSHTNMTGYKNLTAKTDEVMDDGWYHTKDVMHRDKDGWFYIIGREDDMFVCNGENVYPGEVEKMLETHPDIAQAAVVPLDDPVRGAAPIAFIVAAGDTKMSEAEVQAYARANGPAYQFPRRVIFMEEMPLAGTNKIDKASLSERAKAL